MAAAISEFFKDLTAVLDVSTTHRCSIVLCGDFNIHVDETSDSNGKRLLRLLQSSQRIHHVSGPTYTDGHLLDLIFTRDNEPVSDVAVGEFISDHALVTFNIPIAKKPLEHIIKTVRPWKRFDECAFSEDRRHSTIANPSAMHDGMQLEELVDMYDTTLTTLLDKHCPKRTITIRNSLTSPWFDSDCRAERRRVRMLQKRYEKSKNDNDREIWIGAQRAMHKLFKGKEGECWRGRIVDGRRNSK